MPKIKTEKIKEVNCDAHESIIKNISKIAPLNPLSDKNIGLDIVEVCANTLKSMADGQIDDIQAKVGKIEPEIIICVFYSMLCDAITDLAINLNMKVVARSNTFFQDVAQLILDATVLKRNALTSAHENCTASKSKDYKIYSKAFGVTYRKLTDFLHKKIVMPNA